MNAGNWACVFWKSNKCSYLLSHLSSPADNFRFLLQMSVVSWLFPWILPFCSRKENNLVIDENSTNWNKREEDDYPLIVIYCYLIALISRIVFFHILSLISVVAGSYIYMLKATNTSTPVIGFWGCDSPRKPCVIAIHICFTCVPVPKSLISC